MRVRRPLLAVLLAGLVAGAAVPALAERSSDRFSGRVAVPVLPVGADGLARGIVAYEGGLLPGGILDMLTDLGVVRGIGLASIGAVAVTAPEAVFDAIAADDRVLAVTAQRRIALDLYASKGQIGAEAAREADAYTSRGTPTERPAVTGEGVTVAVLDSGIFAPHPDFGDRVPLGLHFAFSEIQDTGGISYEDWDPYVETTGYLALQDEIGHGTHVASTVGGDGSLSAAAGGPDLAGVAPGVEFVSMKVADAPFGIVDDIDWEEAALAAFDYIIRHPDLGIRIAQNSWALLPTEPNCLELDCGEPTDFDAMAEMIGAVEDAGVTVVFSAGNAGPQPGTIGLYHRPDNAILVGAACKSVDSSRCLDDEGAHDTDQVVVDFSSRGAADGSGPQVDVIAPGDNIMAAVSPSVLLPLTECPEFQQPGYYCISGTSMASPHISGIAALMYEVNPDLTPVQVEACLTSTATDVMAPGYDRDSGHGMADTPGALRCAHDLTLLPSGVADVADGLTRLDGADRLATAVATSQAAYPVDGAAAAVVLARADGFADGLAGTPLAVALGGPLLLTPSDALAPATLAEIERLLPPGGRVVLLGGTSALSRDVADAVTAAGFSAERLAGDTRFSTAVRIAEELQRHGPLSSVLLARGDDFPDALASGPAAVAAGGAILLTAGETAAAETEAFLAEHDDLEVVAIGGPASRAHPQAEAVAGDTRETTAVAVAERFLADADVVGITRNDAFADALTGGTHAAALGAPILLTASDVLSEPTATWLDGAQARAAVIYGGEVAVSSSVADAVAVRLR